MGRHRVADARLRAADRRGPRGQPALPDQPGKTLLVKERVNPAAQLRPLKFGREGQFRDIPLPHYVGEALDKHVAGHGATPDGYLFEGRKYKLVVRRSYQGSCLLLLATYARARPWLGNLVGWRMYAR